jgi:RimJ/RimL family protein N-acetyltransferase
MVSLATERLILREFEQDDCPAVHAYASDPHVVQYMGWGPNTEQETRDHMQQTLARQRGEQSDLYAFAVVLVDNKQLIGAVSLRVSSPQDRGGFIGYVFNRHYWGHGYATEAARRLLAFGFEELGLHRVFATCDPRNVASSRVLEKLGMRREGHLRQHKWQKGRWRDSYMYAILAHEWASLNLANSQDGCV